MLGEVVGAAILGPRLKPGQERFQLTAGLVTGVGTFIGLGALSDFHPAVLGTLGFLAGAAPAAAPGGLRTLLTSHLPAPLVVKALSAESILTYAIWLVAPALTTWLALTVDLRLPLFLGGALMAAAAAVLWLLPSEWQLPAGDSQGRQMLRTLFRAWPVYAVGAATMSLFALVELVLPALLEQRSIGTGWTGSLLAGYSAASAVGAAVYGMRTNWPWALRTQSLVLLVALTGFVALAATARTLTSIALALLAAGLLQAGVQMSRTLALREILPSSMHAAGYSVLYAAVGVGYAVSAILAGAVQSIGTPSAAVLTGVGLTLLLTTVSAFGEVRIRLAVAPQK
ncbi:MFS transporter [Streptomyces sp. NPDC001890]|uniref:MFS transporter n=1 Tax=Streptomyces sp. NPDC001890 TaxID=3364620 RepID=UPI0036AC7BE0